MLLLAEVTLAAVKKQMADEEYAKAVSDKRHLPRTSGCDFILAGIEIQEQQCVTYSESMLN
jgi:hypothetical protein